MAVEGRGMGLETLSELAVSFGSDKFGGFGAYRPGAHYYTTHYEKIFAHLRSQPVRLLELGVHRGASLRMWHEWFLHPGSLIVGLDNLPPDPAIEDLRIKFVLGDQDDPAIVPLVGEPGTFDVIIDDCSHEAGRTVRSFELYRPLLKPNGIYVVEDLETSYPPADHHPAQIGGSLGFFQGLVDWINIEPGGSGTSIEQISFYRRMVVLHFGVNL